MVQDGEYGSELVLVSNAEPYVHKKEDGEIVAERGVGGLTSALDPLMQEVGGTWVAWGRNKEDDFDVVDENNITEVPPDAPEEKRYELKRLELSKEEVENFYLGFSNQVLWPACHNFPGKINHEEDYWEFYERVNEKYAEAALEVSEEGDRVWVNDYHLTLVPEMISEEEDVSVSFFLHIPFPPWESFGRIPQREEILKGLSGSDLVGVHTPTYREYLLKAAEKLGAEVDPDEHYYILDGEKTRVEDLSLGIDSKSFSPSGVEEEDKFELGFKEAIGTEHIIIGVDRADYTKGIPERLRAYKLFLKDEDNSKYRGDVTLFQKITISREKIPEYEEIIEEIQVETSRINSELGEIGTWEPVHLRQKRIPLEHLKEIYRSADLALVTPGIDGKNLVGPEFVAAQWPDNPGVLGLSEFAGAAEQFKEELEGKGPLYVNPYNIPETADMIKQGLEMPKEERIERHRNSVEVVRKYDSEYWRNEFLKRWEEAAAR